jgi:3-deoxy-D-manno-octulosonate 8-phosphate phosphatase (KDO 8-P phosphatase)
MNLSTVELVRRAKEIRLVLTDCDGVLTDAGVYYSDRGEELKRFSMRDGMGVACLRAAGIPTGIITGEESLPVVHRAEKLGVTVLHQGVRDKRTSLMRILEEKRLKAENIAYIGDDINDLSIIHAVNPSGITGAPGDAASIVAETVHYRCKMTGGHGAFREFADWILILRSTPAGRTTVHELNEPDAHSGHPILHHMHGGHHARSTRTHR